MKIEWEELTHTNFAYAAQIDRDDVPNAFVESAATVMEWTDYGVEHSCIGHTFLVKAEGRYVGLLLLGEALPWETDPPEMRKEPFYRLMGFVIDKAYRSRGLGGEILEMAIEQVYRDFGKRSVALCCHKDNAGAARFYEKHGFRRTGVTEGNDEYYLRLLSEQTPGGKGRA